jgi:hypothetical protein
MGFLASIEWLGRERQDGLCPVWERWRYAGRMVGRNLLYRPSARLPKREIETAASNLLECGFPA